MKVWTAAPGGGGGAVPAANTIPTYRRCMEIIDFKWSSSPEWSRRGAALGCMAARVGLSSQKAVLLSLSWNKEQGTEVPKLTRERKLANKSWLGFR